MSSSGAARTRQRFPDQLRGLALLGIVVVNVPYLAISVDGYTDESIEGAGDLAVAMAVTFFAEGKFYLIFSFLFGYSATFLVRQAPGGWVDSAGLRRYQRRLVGLAVIGLAHAVFFFIGDILLSYALLGAALMATFTWSNRAVLKFALASYLAATGWLILVLASVVAEGDADAPVAVLTSLDEATATGSFLAVAAARAAALPLTLFTLASAQWGFALAAFALGLVAGRGSYLGDLGAHRVLWRRAALWGLPVGFALQGIAVWAAFTGDEGYGSGTWGYFGVGLGLITAPILSAGYIGALALVHLRSQSFLAATESAGRMSLSVYIGESVVLCVLFCGWGLGWFAQLGAAAVTGIAVVTWAVLALGAHLWLRLGRRGPMETAMAAWVNRAPRRRSRPLPSDAA